MPKDRNWKTASKTVLDESAQPLYYREIAEKAIKKKLVDSIGATPWHTLRVTLDRSIKEDPESPFIKLSSGIYTTKAWVQKQAAGTTEAGPDNDQEDAQRVFTSFGLFWERDEVKWKGQPKLLGKQDEKSEPVDFFDQQGVYTLHDRHELIYVGCSDKDRIGTRLKEHTKKRLKSRWDRFSWFGLKEVGEDGSLKELPETYPAKSLITAMEALLIEVVEPRQNRQGGKDFTDIGYMQVPKKEEKRGDT